MKTVSPDLNHFLRLKKATELMDKIMASPDDAHLFRSKMRLIETQLAYAGVSPGKFLAQYFQNTYASTEAPVPGMSIAIPEEHRPSERQVTSKTRQCRGCGLHFSPKAFNGHGERRCLIRHRKEVPS